MSLEVEQAIEKISLKKKLFFWRLFAVVIFAIVLIPYFLSSSNLEKGKDHIGMISIEGMITDDKYRIEKIKEATENKKIKAVILSVDSPGGEIVASEALYNELRLLAEKKPMVTVMRGMAASGGYMVSLASDYIYAYNGTVTGSIGAVLQNIEISKLAEKIGVGLELFKSSPLKYSPNMYEKTSLESKQAMQVLVNDIQDFFVDLVANRRNLNVETVKSIANGNVFIGRGAKNKGLVDEIGNEYQAKGWLIKEKGVSNKLEVLDVTVSKHKKSSIDFIDLLGKVSGFLASFANYSNNLH